MQLTDTIATPVWLLALLVLAAALAVIEWLLLPGVRLFLRRRVNRVIDELNTRLHIEIRPFQLTRRQVLIERLVFDERVVEAINVAARETGASRELLQRRVRRFAREIVPAFNVYLYFRLGYWLAKRLARMLYRVRIARLDDAKFRAIDPEATVVFVMNHRSNMDYVLVAFLVAERTALSYAVGEWARIWPLQMLVRAMGAFFVRRKSGDPLYRRVLERYVHMATREGVCQAVFPEGRLSRDGRLGVARLGFLDYMLRGFDHQRDRDVVFIPVGINYDRTLEDRTLLLGQDPQAVRRSKLYALRTTLGFLARNIGLMLRSRWRRLGYASVAFGAPLSMREYCEREGVRLAMLGAEQRFECVAALARHLMQEIARLVPALPVAVVASVLRECPAVPLGLHELVRLASARLAALREAGAVDGLPDGAGEQACASAVEMLVLRHLVRVESGRCSVPREARGLLDYYANSLSHWDLPALSSR